MMFVQHIPIRNSLYPFFLVEIFSLYFCYETLLQISKELQPHFIVEIVFSGCMSIWAFYFFTYTFLLKKFLLFKAIFTTEYFSG